MADREPDAGAELHKTQVRILFRVAGGALLQTAAKHEGVKLAALFDLALSDSAFARALLVAQNERAARELEGLHFAVDAVEAAVNDVRVAVDQ